MPASVMAYAAFAFFGFYTFYGLYLDLKLARFHRGGKLLKAERWEPANYAAGAEPWITRNRRWERWQTTVWLVCALAVPLLAALLQG